LQSLRSLGCEFERVTLAELAALREMLETTQEDRAALEKRVRAEERERCITAIRSVRALGHADWYIEAIQRLK